MLFYEDGLTHNVCAVTPLALTAETFPKVITVLDSALSATTKPIALRASSSTSTIFVSGSDLSSYIQSLASSTPDAAFHEIDFTALSSEAVPTGAKPAQPAKAQKEKERKQKRLLAPPAEDADASPEPAPEDYRYPPAQIHDGTCLSDSV